MQNVTNSLRRHDWVHRWTQVLDAAGLPHMEPMRQRVDLLERLAAMTEQSIGPEVEELPYQGPAVESQRSSDLAAPSARPEARRGYSPGRPSNMRPAQVYSMRGRPVGVEHRFDQANKQSLR